VNVVAEDKKTEKIDETVEKQTKETKKTKVKPDKKVKGEKKSKKQSKTATQIEELKKQITELNGKVDAITDQYIRAKAETANIQKRNEKEQANLVKYDGQHLAKDILPVIDNLERALAIEVSDENGKQLKKGIQMVFDHMNKALKDNHVTEIEAVGQPFDPHIHQAVQTVAVEEGGKADQVVSVLQKGYMLKDRVLRPAMVVVSQ
jgi:molecular chaperone GrpE